MGKAWAVVAPSAPLQEIDISVPEPSGSEVVVRTTHCGVCHSDLHFWKGEYNMGGGRVMKLAERGVTLPRAPGHEVVGQVVAVGPEAREVPLGSTRVVYPWIGCGRCDACLAEQDNLCLEQRSIGVMRHGGFASHVVVPHPRYLVDPGAVDPALAATYACSGITVYSAVRKILPLAPDRPVALIGAGGLGLAAIAMLKAFGQRAILSVDVSADKLAAAAAAGATITVDGSGPDVAARAAAAAGGPVRAVIDFVNTSATARAGFDMLAKGGKLVVVGVAGGDLTLSLAGLVFRAQSVEGTNTGTPQDLRDVLAMANAGRLAPTPVTRMPRDSAEAALRTLHDGRVTGRLVLTDEPAAR